jgi:hypothetical protein
VDPFVALTDDLLYEERGREMYAEMTRRQDQIRFGKWNAAWWAKPASTPTQNLFPIPKHSAILIPALFRILDTQEVGADSFKI